ncbi:hypothetical protein FE634_21525 [Nocardioides dongxiaopingii]|uniref:hypothetical protein n=1 Tax=Nocardioides TaxID=1839 RepID=UPI0010C76E60|nr:MULTISPECIES: hypothetical protein [Nocardioides]QDH10730.1 hypothetical protein FE634_21525 [Nocardioides sp. S-1144]
MSKLTLAVAFGAGYVLGARAGRGRYEQIRAKAQKVAEDPRVQSAADSAKVKAGEVAATVADTAKVKAGEVASTVAETAKDKVGRHTSDQDSTP